MTGQQQGLTMLFLRAWMWLVPIGMIAAAVMFGTIAAVDGRWGLLAVMVLMGVIGVALMLVHWWLLYRFGRAPGGES
jgi:hypothetical protein